MPVTVNRVLEDISVALISLYFIAGDHMETFTTNIGIKNVYIGSS